MSQFTVYKNRNSASKKVYPYLLDIQSNFLSELKSTVVLPLSPARKTTDIVMSRLNPEVEINGEKFIIMTQDLAGITRSVLKTKVCDLKQHQQEIIAAMDFVLSGI